MTVAKAIVAFDHTRVSMSQLEWAYKITPIFEALIKNEEEKQTVTEEEKKAEKPKKQKQQKKKNNQMLPSVLYGTHVLPG